MRRDDLRSGAHVVHRLHAHVVLTPKYRRSVMSERVTEECLRGSLAEVCATYDASLDAFETDQDHAHLLISYPPRVTLSRLVGACKSVSSRQVREQRVAEVTQALWGEHFWSLSYAVISCGGAPLDIVRSYIESQQAPGRRRPSHEQPDRALRRRP